MSYRAEGAEMEEKQIKISERNGHEDSPEPIQPGQEQSLRGDEPSEPANAKAIHPGARNPSESSIIYGQQATPPVASDSDSDSFQTASTNNSLTVRKPRQPRRGSMAALKEYLPRYFRSATDLLLLSSAKKVAAPSNGYQLISASPSNHRPAVIVHPPTTPVPSGLHAYRRQKARQLSVMDEFGRPREGLPIWRSLKAKEITSREGLPKLVPDRFDDEGKKAVLRMKMPSTPRILAADRGPIGLEDFGEPLRLPPPWVGGGRGAGTKPVVWKKLSEGRRMRDR